MSKAIAGAAMIAADLAIGAAIFLNPALLPVLVAALPGGIATLNGIIMGLFAGGVSMEAGALASALTSQRGSNISTRMAAGLRQIVYGQQRIGGNIVYESTTGSPGHSGNYVFNFVIVLASHSIDSIVNLYLDGRQVFWRSGPSRVNPSGYHANVGCGTVSTPPTCSVTRSGGAITAISASGGVGFSDVIPADGYRVKITGGGGSGAVAWAHNSGTGYSPVWTVTMTHGGSGYTSTPHVDIQGAYTFGGNSRPDDPDPSHPGYHSGYAIGPGGPHYNFDGKVYCEARFGDQLPDDYMHSLAAYDHAWLGNTAGSGATGTATVGGGHVMAVSMGRHGLYTSAPSVNFTGGGGMGAIAHCVMSGSQVGYVAIDNPGMGYTSAPAVNFSGGGSPTEGATPYLGGCAYIYLNIGYDTAMFQQLPEIRLTVNGKDTIFDPRTNKTGFSANWALQVADVITDPVFGLGDDTVNQAQLIAAANACDSTVASIHGGEKLYQQHIHYDTSTSPGDALALMMPTAAGRLSRIGGEWYIWPAMWQGPSFTVDQSSLLGDVSWQPYRSFKDLVNCVNGTYVAPNYPYTNTGNLYDANGFYYGQTDNLWPFAWQPTSFPQYAVDVLHGYGTNVYLDQDGGVVLPKELTFQGIISVAQAQRVAKIFLMRNRMQGSGLFEMGLAAWKMQPLDVMSFNFPAMDWVNKTLEIEKIQLKAEPMQGADGSEGALALSCSVSVIETDASVYEWSVHEELTVYDVLAFPESDLTTPPAPTGLTLTDDSSTQLVQSDGTIMPRLLVQWTEPDDIYTQTGGTIQIQWQDYDGVYLSGNWVDAGSVSGIATHFFLNGVSAVTHIAVQIRSVRANGNASAWVQATLGTPGGVFSSNENSYTISPAFSLTNLASTSVAMSAVTATFNAGTVNYSARTFSIPAPSAATWYYITITDPSQSGESSPTLTATCQTAETLVGQLGVTFIGAIQAMPTGGGTNGIIGGWPNNLTINNNPPNWPSRPRPPHAPHIGPAQ